MTKLSMDAERVQGLYGLPFVLLNLFFIIISMVQVIGEHGSPVVAIVLLGSGSFFAVLQTKLSRFFMHRAGGGESGMQDGERAVGSLVLEAAENLDQIQMNNGLRKFCEERFSELSRKWLFDCMRPRARAEGLIHGLIPLMIHAIFITTMLSTAVLYLEVSEESWFHVKPEQIMTTMMPLMHSMLFVMMLAGMMRNFSEAEASGRSLLDSCGIERPGMHNGVNGENEEPAGGGRSTAASVAAGSGRAAVEDGRGHTPVEEDAAERRDAFRLLKRRSAPTKNRSGDTTTQHAQCGRIKTIRFDGVSFVFDQGPKNIGILENFNFDLIDPKTRNVALVGPSGCGKSTTLNLLLQVYKATIGSIVVEHDAPNEQNLTSAPAGADADRSPRRRGRGASSSKAEDGPTPSSPYCK